MDDPDTGLQYAWYDISASGQIIASPNYLSAEQTVLADYYDVEQGQSDYQFTSQPLTAARSRVVQIRTLDVRSQGTGEVSITLYGRRDKTAYDPIVFHVDSTEPVLMHFPVAVDAYDPYYSIVARSDESELAAPSVLSLNWGHRQSATAPSPRSLA